MMKLFVFPLLLLIAASSCKPPLYQQYKAESWGYAGFMDTSRIFLEIDTAKQQFNLQTQHTNSMVGNRKCTGIYIRKKNRLELIPQKGSYQVDPDLEAREYRFIFIDETETDTLDYAYIMGETFELDTVAPLNFTLVRLKK